MAIEIQNEKKILETQIENLNEEIKSLGYELGGLLNVDCSFGVCTYDPEAEDLQDKLREVQEQKALLEKIKKNLRTCIKK